MYNEEWQIFHENGQSIAGRSLPPVEFTDDYIMGAAHVWLWRKDGETVEILLQKRADDTRTWPGYTDISAAGRVDAGETPLESAVREAKEELGLDIDREALRFLFTMRTPLAPNESDFVYSYQAPDDFELQLTDGEVAMCEWATFDKFKEMTARPDDYHLVPQGDHYFALLINDLETQFAR